MERVIAARYELRKEIGRGPHGIVWRARHQRTGAECAVKVLHHQFATDAAVVDRFVQAEPVLMAFVHPAYVRVRDVVVDPGELALVTELVDGVDLHRRIATSGALTPGSALAMTAAAASAVAAGHDAGIVHCNIKSSNLILTGEVGRVRVTDCRIARLARGLADIGDDAYAAPEVRAGSIPVRASDVYGLGIVLYEALTGTPPKSAGPDLLAEAPQGTIDERLRHVLERCVATNPDERMSAKELATDLRRLADQLRSGVHEPDPVVTGRNSATTLSRELTTVEDPRPLLSPAAGEPEHPHVGRPPRRRPPRWLVAIATLVAFLFAVLISVASWSADDAPSDAEPVPVPRDDAPTAIRTLPTATDMPQPPAAATAETAAGATAFVPYWFDTLNHALQTGDDTSLRTASSPDCEICAAALVEVASGHESGRKMQGGTYTVRSVQVDSFFDITRPILRVVYDRTTRSTIDADSRIVATLPGIAFASCQVVLERVGNQWRVLDVQTSVPVV